LIVACTSHPAVTAAVWFYALAWFLVTDRVKLLVYRVLDPVKVQPKREAKSPPDAGPQIAG
jgi:H+-transporting ATPase